jgi:hypothetical protein
MLILDDVLVKPFFSVLDILHTLALGEMYDMESIQDNIKENQLLYEIGERSKAEYEERKRELEVELEMAKLIQSQMQDRVEVKH